MDISHDKVFPVLKKIHDQGKGVLAIKVLGDGEMIDDGKKTIEFVNK